MKRTTPLRRTSLRRRSPMRTHPRSTSYSRRPRDLEFMRFCRRQPCIVRTLPPYLFMEVAKVVGYKALTPCEGPIEADHMGARGIGQKADDRTCVGICRGHHRERTDHMRSFRPLVQAELRLWRAAAIEHTQRAWSNR